MSDIRERARIAVVNKVEALRASFTVYPLTVEYANGNVVNTALQTRPYLRVQIRYQDGQQIGLSLTPGHRLLGTIVVEACVKEGSGTRQANELLAHFYPALHMKDSIPPLRTLASRFAPVPLRDGWTGEAALIPFWVDSLTP